MLLQVPNQTSEMRRRSSRPAFTPTYTTAVYFICTCCTRTIHEITATWTMFNKCGQLANQLSYSIEHPTITSSLREKVRDGGG